MLEKLNTKRLQIVLNQAKDKKEVIINQDFILNKDLDPLSRILLLIMLAKDDDKDGKVDITKNALQSLIGRSVRKVDILLSELIEKGYLVSQRNGKTKPNSYYFKFLNSSN